MVASDDRLLLPKLAAGYHLGVLNTCLGQLVDDLLFGVRRVPCLYPWTRLQWTAVDLLWLCRWTPQRQLGCACSCQELSFLACS